MGGAYQRTLTLTLLALAALPVLVLASAIVVLARQPGLGPGDVAGVALFVAIGLLAAACATALGAGRALGAPIQRLIEGVGLMSGPNPGYRLAPPEERDLAQLAVAVNQLADQAQRGSEVVAAELQAATRELESEKETLASVLFALADGVVVCDEEYRVLLSNAAARRMLSRPGLPLRRGSSIFTHVDAVALRPLGEALATRRPEPRASDAPLERGTLSLPSGTVARVHATVTTGDPSRRHLVFVFRDVTRRVTAERSRDRLIGDAVRRLRPPVSAILSAGEILQGYDELEPSRRRAFLDVVHQEAERLAAELDALGGATLAPSWADDTIALANLVEHAAAELAPALAARAQRLSMPGVEPGAEPRAGDGLLVPGDRLALLQVTRRLLELASAATAEGAELRVAWRRVEASLAELTVEMAGSLPKPLDDADFDTPLTARADPDGAETQTLREAVKEHRGELWTRRNAEAAAIVLWLPTAPPNDPGPTPSSGGDGDAVGHQVLELLSGGFFDARPPVEALAASADARLADLSFAVFDLETTGLGPGRGDRIVSIGAVRVRGGRVIPEDHFTALVDPGRPIPLGATRIHGITDQMVAGQPPVEAVLPGFIAFVGESVPVAHVAAFDLAFLNPRLEGIGQPPIPRSSVLDTMLLACSLFPAWNGYNVEEIAAQLGVAVIGRHTALGDALTTAHILVRLLTILEQREVTTLGAALKLQGGDVVRKLVGAVEAELHWG